MDVYLLINVCISALALVLIKFVQGSNQANYWLSSFAILAWFIPYSWLAQFIPSQVLTAPIIINQSLVSVSTTLATTTGTMLEFSQIIEWLALACFAIGLILFIKQIVNLLKLNGEVLTDDSLEYHQDLSEQYQVPVYSVANAPSGMLLGFRKPKVIISNAINDKQQLNLIVCHEKTHIARYDNYRLAFLALAECLFWWNPLVRKLVATNRVFIEALCDESASKAYGIDDYINDFAGLILRNNQHNMHSLYSTATSCKSNNILRLKLLKENRVMTLNKKLTYVATIFTALLAMTWNTLAIATNNTADSLTDDNYGALVNLDVKVQDRSDSEQESIRETTMAVWVDFDKQVAIKIGDKFAFNFKVSDQGELAAIDMEIIEIANDSEKVISKPKLKTAFKQAAVIEIDNDTVSPHAYAIKLTPERALQPE